MINPERSRFPISPSLFQMAIGILARKSTLSSPQELRLRDDWGIFDNDIALESNQVVGREGVMSGKQGGVTHRIHMRLFNGASQINGPGILVADIRVNAAEGDFEPYDKEFERHVGQGLLTGMIEFNRDRTVDADFALGSWPSDNPVVQHRLEEMVSAFGLPTTIIRARNRNQYFNYDNAAIDKMIENLPTFE
jgi:hypothetical protein